MVCAMREQTYRTDSRSHSAASLHSSLSSSYCSYNSRAAVLVNRLQTLPIAKRMPPQHARTTATLIQSKTGGTECNHGAIKSCQGVTKTTALHSRKDWHAPPTAHALMGPSAACNVISAIVAVAAQAMDTTPTPIVPPSRSSV